MFISYSWVDISVWTFVETRVAFYFLPEIVNARLGPGAGSSVEPCVVVQGSVHCAAVEAGAGAGPDLLTDEAVGDHQHSDWEEEEGQAEKDGVVRVGQPAGEHGRAPLNGGNNS